jgi:sugar phosphate isomerase/epimerase
MRLSYTFATAECKAKRVLGFRGDLDHACGELAALGYEGVSLLVRAPREVDQEQVERTIRRHGLAVPALVTGALYGEDRLSLNDADPAGRGRARERLREVIEMAARFGAQIHLGRFRGYLPEEGGAEDALARLREELWDAAEYAHPRGVQLLLEPLCHFEANHLLTVGEAVAFARALGHPGVAVIADTFHMNIEEVSLPASLVAAGSALAHIHFADSNRRYPGAGHVNFRAVVEALRLAGYDGFITVEIKQEPDPPTAARRAAQTIRALLDAG